MDYAAISNRADGLIRTVGLQVKLLRNGAQFGTAYGVFIASAAENQSEPASSLLASTTVTTRALLLSGLSKEPQVGDLVVAESGTYGITKVEKVRPAKTTVLYKLEVS